ncbi:MAG: MFS transporter [Geodermatophilaceae bacterium]
MENGLTASQNDALTNAKRGRGGRTPMLVYLAVLGGYTGQQLLTPVLPPLARELSLSELQLGSLMSASALMVVLTSTRWGHRVDVWGHKPLLVGALFGTALGTLGFAVVADIGMSGGLTTTAVFVLFLLTRGVIFGGALAALPVAAYSYVADVTSGQQERVKGLSLVGASLGLGLVLGPALGGLLGQFGLLTALYTAPVVLAVMGVGVWLRLPREDRRTDRPTPSKVSASDPRMWPYLTVGLALYLSISLLSMSIGFLVQDRLGLDSAGTAGSTGVILLAGGLPMLLVQGFVVPKLGWSPVTLLRVGVPVAGVAFGVLVFAPDFITLLIATTVAGVGHSLAMPGYNAAPSLAFGPEEQGGVAGLIGSTNALTLVIGPLAATSLYQVAPGAPFALGAAVLLAAFMFVLTYPGFRNRRS